MSSHHWDPLLDLLGQAARPLASARLPGDSEPQLHVAWDSFRQSLGSSFCVLLSRARTPKSFFSAGYFKDCRIDRRIPRRAVVAAALWHVAFLVFPFPEFSQPRHNPALDNVQLTWSGPIEDLPLLNIPAAKPKAAPRGAPEKPPPQQGAGAFHPRQRIFTDPVHPTHPRQTLINPAAPPDAPKLVPNLPNIVMLQQNAGPARPRLQISEEALRKLRPRQRRTAAVASTSAPVLQNLEQRPADLSVASSLSVPAQPKLVLNTGSAPRVAARAQQGDAVPAPDVGSAQSSANGNPSTLIALSATPAPPSPTVEIPNGNLAARVSISPEGKSPGSPGGAKSAAPSAGGGGGGEAGNNSVGVSISGGNPKPGATMSGPGGNAARSSAPPPRLIINKPAANIPPDDPPVRTGPPNFSSLPDGARPETVFASKRVYTLNVNMPNLNSATGSWILNFSELRTNPYGPHFVSPDLSGPVPLRKVDPKYPPALIQDHVEGEVVLYAVIRSDGSVDAIQLVHGIDEQLDANAMSALKQWKFRPASKHGAPVELEAIVHIPFRAPTPLPN